MWEAEDEKGQGWTMLPVGGGGGCRNRGLLRVAPPPGKGNRHVLTMRAETCLCSGVKREIERDGD